MPSGKEQEWVLLLYTGMYLRKSVGLSLRSGISFAVYEIESSSHGKERRAFLHGTTRQLLSPYSHHHKAYLLLQHCFLGRSKISFGTGRNAK